MHERTLRAFAAVHQPDGGMILRGEIGISVPHANAEAFYRACHEFRQHPPGVAGGMQIRLSGEGDHGRYGGPPGDLYVDIEVEPHAFFERDGDNIKLEVRVNAADAALGSELEVPTLDGPARVKMPAGTQTGDTFRLDGAGVPHLRRAGRGDQIVTVYVATPPRLSREQRELFEQLRSTLPRPEVVPQAKTGFWDRVRERFS